MLISSAKNPSDPSPADGFLLARPTGRNALLHRLRAVWREIVAAVGITTRIVPHQLRHYAASRTMPHVGASTGIDGH